MTFVGGNEMTTRHDDADCDLAPKLNLLLVPPAGHSATISTGTQWP